MKTRTTKFYFNRFGIKLVIWRKEHRPVRKKRVTDQQIESARSRMLESETAS